MADCFYEPLDDNRFRSTPATVGPWSENSQHAGPPSALLARALERCNPRPDAMLARVTVEILGPVPVDELTVQASVLRPGRSVELLGGELLAGGRPVLRAQAWRIRTADVDVPADARTKAPPPELPADAAEPVRPPRHPGYLGAMQWRYVRGGFEHPGPATVWGRQRLPLVDGEEPSAAQRVLTAADSGNGVSAVLDWRTHLFINCELTVHLFRPLQGEWVCLDAETLIGPDGVGLAENRLYDEAGRIGSGHQALLIGPR